MRRRLTLAYVTRGYINSGAIIPDQKIASGVVVYRVIEGKLSDIVVDGTNWLNPGYVRGRLAQSAGPPLNIGRVEDRVQLLLQDPLINRMNVELVPVPRRARRN